MRSHFSRIIHIFVLISYCHLSVYPVWGMFEEEADYTIKVSRHVLKQKRALKESLYIEISFKSKKEDVFKGENSYRFVRPLFRLDEKSSETSSYSDVTKVFDGKRLTTAEENFLSHVPQFKALSFNAAGSLFIDGLKDDEHLYAFMSDGEVSFANTAFKKIKVQANAISIHKNVILTHLSSNLQDSQGYFQIFPQGSLDVTTGEFRGGTFLNRGVLSAQENQTLDFKGTSIFNEGNIKSPHAIEFQNMARFENRGTLFSPNFKARGKIFYNFHQISVETLNILAFHHLRNTGEIKGNILKAVSLGAFYNSGHITGRDSQHLVSQKDFLNESSGGFFSSDLHIESFGKVINLGQLYGKTGDILAHLLFENKGLVQGSFKNRSLASFLNNGVMEGENLSVTAPHSQFTKDSKINSEKFSLETSIGVISGDFKVRHFLGEITKSLEVAEDAIFSLATWSLNGKGRCLYKTISGVVSCLSFNSFGAFINEGVLTSLQSVEGMCEHFTNWRVFKTSHFNLTLQILKNCGILKGSGNLVLESGENAGNFGSEMLSLEVQRIFQNTGEVSAQSLSGEGLFQNQGILSGKGSQEAPVVMSIRTFENGDSSSQKEGHISAKALRVMHSVTLRLPECSFLQVPYIKIEIPSLLLNEGEIETHVFNIEGNFLNKGEIEGRDFFIRGTFTNQGNVQCLENGVLNCSDVQNEGSISGEAWEFFAKKINNTGKLRAYKKGSIEAKFMTNALGGIVASPGTLRLTSTDGFLNHGTIQSDQRLGIFSKGDVYNDGTVSSQDLTLKARKAQNKGTLEGLQKTEIETTLGYITLEGGSSFLGGLRFVSRGEKLFQNEGSLTLKNLESFEGVTGIFNEKKGKIWIEDASLRLSGNFENHGYMSLGKGTYHVCGRVVIGKEGRLVAPHKESDTLCILEETHTLPEEMQEALFSIGGMRLFAGAIENKGSIETPHSFRFLTQRATCGLIKAQERIYLQAKKAAKFLLKNHALLFAKKVIIETETFLLNQKLTLKSLLEVRAREFLNEAELEVPGFMVQAQLFRNGESPQKPGSITSDTDTEVFATTIQNEFGHLYGKKNGRFVSPDKKGDMTVGTAENFKSVLRFGGETTVEVKSFKNAWGQIFSTQKMSITCAEDFESSSADSFLATASNFEILARNITNKFGQFCVDGHMFFTAHHTFINHSGLIFGSHNATIKAFDFFNTRTGELLREDVGHPHYKEAYWMRPKYAAAYMMIQGVLTINAENSVTNLASHMYGARGLYETSKKSQDRSLSEVLHGKTEERVKRPRKQFWNSNKQNRLSESKVRETIVVLATRSSSREVKTSADFAAITGTVSGAIVTYEGKDLEIGIMHPMFKLSGVTSQKRCLNLRSMLDPSLTQGFFTKREKDARGFIGTRFPFGEEVRLPSMTHVTSQMQHLSSVPSETIPLFDTTALQIATVKAFTQSFNRGYLKTQKTHLSILEQIKILMENAKVWLEKERAKENEDCIVELRDDEVTPSSVVSFSEDDIDALEKPMLVFTVEKVDEQPVSVPNLLIPKKAVNPSSLGSEGVVYGERVEIDTSSTVTLTGTVSVEQHAKLKTSKFNLRKNFVQETLREEKKKSGKKTVTETTVHHAQPGGNLLSGDLLEVDAKITAQGATIVAQKAVFKGPLLDISSIILKNKTSVTETSRKGIWAKGEQKTETETSAVGRAFLAVLELHINTEESSIRGADVQVGQLYNETERGLSFASSVAEMKYATSQKHSSLMGRVKTETTGGQEIEVPTTLNVGVIFSPDASLTLTNVKWDKLKTEIQGKYEENFRHLESWQKTHSSGRKINPGIAAVISLAVGFATMGSGAALAAGLGFEGVTLGGIVGSAMVQGAFTGICSQASISLLANGGNPKETLRDLSTRESILSLAISVVGAGVTAGLASKFDINLAPGEKTFGEYLEGSALRSSVSTGLNIVAQKGDLKEAFVAGLKTTAVNTIGAYGTNQIASFKADLGPVFHKMAHGILGGITGYLIDSKEGVLGGAMGAALAEIIAYTLAPEAERLTKELRDEAKENGKTLSDAQVQKEIGDRIKATSNFARLGAGIVTLLAGENVAVAIETATTAVENNFLTALPEIQERGKDFWTACDVEEAYAEGGREEACRVLIEKGILIRDVNAQGYKVLYKRFGKDKALERSYPSLTEAWKGILDNYKIMGEMIERYEIKHKKERFFASQEEQEKRFRSVDLKPKVFVKERPLPLKKGEGVLALRAKSLTFTPKTASSEKIKGIRTAVSKKGGCEAKVSSFLEESGVAYPTCKITQTVAPLFPRTINAIGSSLASLEKFGLEFSRQYPRATNFIVEEGTMLQYLGEAVLLGSACTFGQALGPAPCIGAFTLVSANHAGFTEYAFKEASAEIGYLLNTIPGVDPSNSNKTAGLMLGASVIGMMGKGSAQLVTSRAEKAPLWDVRWTASSRAAAFEQPHGKKAIQNMSTAEFTKSIAHRADLKFGGKGPEVGKQKHKFARELAERYQRMTGDKGHLMFEQRFIENKKWEKGMGLKGSVVPDVYDPLTHEVFDYKFGDAYLGKRQIRNTTAAMPQLEGKHLVMTEVKPQ